MLLPVWAWNALSAVWALLMTACVMVLIFHIGMTEPNVLLLLLLLCCYCVVVVLLLFFILAGGGILLGWTGASSRLLDYNDGADASTILSI